MAGTISRLSISRNQETTHESTYKSLIVSEINETKELSEGIFPINLKSIDQYQCKYPILMDNYTIGAYQKDSFCGVSNINLELIMCEDDILIPLILQS